MNIDLVLKRLELIKEGKGIGTISDVEASIILNKIERLKKNQKLTPEERNHLHLELDEIIESLQLENERLNNIINELEKWLEEQHQFIIEIPAFTKEISIEHKTMEICYENILDKIQELKGE